MNLYADTIGYDYHEGYAARILPDGTQRAHFGTFWGSGCWAEAWRHETPEDVNRGGRRSGPADGSTKRSAGLNEPHTRAGHGPPVPQGSRG